MNKREMREIKKSNMDGGVVSKALNEIKKAGGTEDIKADINSPIGKKSATPIPLPIPREKLGKK